MFLLYDFTLLLFCRPMEFLNCSEPLNLNGNETRKKELGHGCLKVRIINGLNIEACIQVHKKQLNAYSR